MECKVFSSESDCIINQQIKKKILFKLYSSGSKQDFPDLIDKHRHTLSNLQVIFINSVHYPPNKYFVYLSVKKRMKIPLVVSKGYICYSDDR